ncbi:MAG TPA: DNA repair protein RadC [Candidatus Eisenbacteria bacterium]|uniref:DNA repair protein RadC n=1 Tax=Eiseniibacteriota bacterium TaxID=2212470 RepID=A0A7V2F2V8_UNCEI|nr:DNA repair protein RadC [Candidatus Eisenbacteria bacterium]
MRGGDVAKSSLDALRRRFYLRGPEGIGDEGLIALVMGAGNGRSAGMIAQELMDRYGGLEGIGNAGVQELIGAKGVGSACAVRLLAAFELGRRCITCGREAAIRRVRSPEDVAELMIPEMRGLDREYFKAVLLDTKNGIKRIVTVAVGSLNAALVHPREIFKAAVAASAAGIILVHNHPTGNPEPSNEDADLTVRFAGCGELMGIDLVDHIIIGGNSYVSMRERDLIPR